MRAYGRLRREPGEWVDVLQADGRWEAARLEERDEVSPNEVVGDDGATTSDVENGSDDGGDEHVVDDKGVENADGNGDVRDRGVRVVYPSATREWIPEHQCARRLAPVFTFTTSTARTWWHHKHLGLEWLSVDTERKQERSDENFRWLLAPEHASDRPARSFQRHVNVDVTVWSDERWRRTRTLKCVRRDGDVEASLLTHELICTRRQGGRASTESYDVAMAVTKTRLRDWRISRYHEVPSGADADSFVCGAQTLLPADVAAVRLAQMRAQYKNVALSTPLWDMVCDYLWRTVCHNDPVVVFHTRPLDCDTRQAQSHTSSRRPTSTPASTPEQRHGIVIGWDRAGTHWYVYTPATSDVTARVLEAPNVAETCSVRVSDFERNQQLFAVLPRAFATPRKRTRTHPSFWSAALTGECNDNNMTLRHFILDAFRLSTPFGIPVTDMPQRNN